MLDAQLDIDWWPSLAITLSLPIAIGCVWMLFARWPRGVPSHLSSWRNRVHNSLNEQFLRLSGSSHDLSLKQLEENRVKTLALQSASNGIMIIAVVDQQLTIEYANPEFHTMLGLVPNYCQGQSLQYLIERADDQSAFQEFLDAVACLSDAEIMLQFLDANQQPLYCEVRVSPVDHPSGKTRHCVAVFNDVTDRIAYETELRKARGEAVKASEAKSEFLANMSHEIRTPLTAILGCTDAIIPTVNDPQVLEAIHVIRHQGQLLLGIVNDILDLSKIEAGRLTLIKEPTSIVSIVADVCSTMRPSAVDKGVELNVKFGQQIPESVESDPLRLRQILANLVSNAIKFTDQGEVVLDVQCETTKQQVNLLITVKDTGVGIASDQLQAIFQAFTQAHGILNRRVGGTGLGLTICQRLTDMLGGSIQVQSQVGKGSQFQIRLPVGSLDRVRLLPSADLTSQSAHLHPYSIKPTRLRGSILIAEDTRSIQFTLRRMLSGIVDELTIVGTGLEAIREMASAQARGHPYDLVLMDIQMPELDGYAATKHLRNEGYSQPIIALTAGAMEGERDRCLQAGCTDYLAKPIHWEKLRSILQQYLRPQLPNSTMA